MGNLLTEQRPGVKPDSQPDLFVLGSRDVHIWQLSLDQSPVLVNRLRQLLASDEVAKAGRFHFGVDGVRFIVARGGLRIILSRYLKIRPEEIEFSYSEYGKPQIVPSDELQQPLNFNLAHSAAVAIYAFTRLREIGIDIEQIRSEFAGEEIARRFFSAGEAARLANLPIEMRQTAFFNCWTRKEAFIKAKGLGLSLPLDQFDVTLDPSEPARLLRTAWDEEEAAQWSLQSVETDPAYVAAVAVRAHDFQLNCRNLPAETLL